MAKIPQMKELLEAGVHFGHQVRKWHPSMKTFIFGVKDGVHIIDLSQTVSSLEKAYNFVKDLSSKGGKIIFLATKKQAKEIVKEEAERSGALFIIERWIGGLITNYEEVSKNIKKLLDLEAKRANEDEMKIYTKKESVLMDREIIKLDRIYGGVRDLNRLPDALFIIDVKREETAAREAKKRGVPVVAIADTNANLDLIDYPIPGNDDSIKSIKIITETIASAVAEGKGIQERGEVIKEKGEVKSDEGEVEKAQEKPKEKPVKDKQKSTKGKETTKVAKKIIPKKETKGKPKTKSKKSQKK